MIEKYNNDPNYLYFKENTKMNAVILPILEHIFN